MAHTLGRYVSVAIPFPVAPFCHSRLFLHKAASASHPHQKYIFSTAQQKVSAKIYLGVVAPDGFKKLPSLTNYSTHADRV